MVMVAVDVNVSSLQVDSQHIWLTYYLGRGPAAAWSYCTFWPARWTRWWQYDKCCSCYWYIIILCECWSLV